MDRATAALHEVPTLCPAQYLYPSLSRSSVANRLSAQRERCQAGPPRGDP